MYRDVKKKLLSVAICICMLIGMVQVVPKAKAAAQIDGLAIKVEDAEGDSYVITVDKLSFPYNGKRQVPSIQDVSKNGAPLQDSVYASWSFVPKTDGTTVKEHTCYLSAPNGFFKESDTTFNYSITSTTISMLIVEYDKSTPVAWTASGALPKITKATAQTSNGPIELNSNQYEVTPVDNGKDTGTKTATFKVTDATNFDLIATATENKEETLTYMVAYLLSGSAASGTTKREMYLADTTGQYDGSSYTPRIGLKATGNSGGTVITPSDYSLSVSYAKNGEKISSIVNAGTYTVTVKPSTYDTNHNATVEIDGDYFMGCFEGTFIVNAGSNSSLSVYAIDEQMTPANSKKIYENGSQIETLIYNYNDGNAVYLKEPHIYEVKGGVTADVTDFFEKPVYTPTIPKAGNVIVKWTPKEDSNYSDDIEINYFIASGLNIYSLAFIGSDPSTAEMPEVTYTGDPVAPYAIVVKDAEGNTVDKKYYNVTYKYYQNGEELPATGGEADSNLATPGIKKVIVTGTGRYASVGSVERTYKVCAVNMEGDGIFNLSLTGLRQNSVGEYYAYYNGAAWTPGTVLTYKRDISSPEQTLVKDTHYTVSYSNNTAVSKNESTATVTVTGIESAGFSGSKTVKFSISPLSLSLAKAVGDTPEDGENAYTYTGRKIEPEIHLINKVGGDTIYDYALTANDYTILGYTDKNGNALESAPVDVGEYKVTIQNQNVDNISGDTYTVDYKIVPKDIAGIGFQLQGTNGDNREIEWNGSETMPVLTGTTLESPRDYTYRYINCDHVDNATGSAMVEITGAGNYTGTKTIKYTITPRVFKSGDNSDFSFSASKSGSLTTGGYKIKMTVRDEARTTETLKQLHLGTDYEIASVFYYDDKAGSWEEEALEVNTDYTVEDASDTLTIVKKAGKYRITIKGKGNYSPAGTLELVQACGTDISAYYVHINDSKTNYTYTGNTITPASISLFTSEGANSQIASDCYEVEYKRKDSYENLLSDVGTIYLVATGEPTKGYYGKTGMYSDKAKKACYTISAPVWSYENPLTVAIVSAGPIYYNPNGTREPSVIVSYAGIKLEEDKDYKVTYIGSQEAGKDREIRITGIGNYASENNISENGTPKQNIWPVYYDVLPIDISSNQIHEETKEVDFGKGTAGFELKYIDYVLVDTKDFIKTVSGDEIHWNDDKKIYQTTYIVTGKGNFSGTRTVNVTVNKSSLADGYATFAESAQLATPGAYYVQWSDEEMFVQNPERKLEDRPKRKPTNFSVNYKKSETETITLTPGEDYEILVDPSDPDKYYGTNATPGYSVNNYLTIRGLNGYTGTRKLYFTLYTDISKVQLATTSTLQESTGASGTAITKSKWKAVYEGSTTDPKSDGLVILNSLYQGESFIDPSEYDISWPGDLNLADPAVGTYKATIVGTPNNSLGENAHYYKGNRDVTFTIVNGIENAEIKVNSNNCVQYTGGATTVTGAATTLSVKVDNVALTLGRDFEIVGYENNTQIGEAIVKIKGIGNYQGEAQGTFFITYPLSKMGVQMQNAENSWVDISNGSNVSFKYNHVAKEPLVRLYCKEFEEDIENLTHPFTMAGGYFEIEYLNNTDAGTATARIKNCKYFTSDIGFRDISFAIVKSSICPTAVTGGTITYSPIAAVNGNLSITYTGKSITVEDLKLALYDGGNLLSVGTDYAVFYKNDNQNVSITGSEPVITVKGIGNYDDDYSFTFKITPKDINDGISVQPVMITFTGGTIEEAVKLQMHVLQDDIGKTLKCGTDFTIDAYYLDEYGHALVTGESGIPNAKGTYYAKISGIGNYSGNRLVQINVSQKDMGEGMTIQFTNSDHCQVAQGVPQCVYDGTAHEPGVVVTYGSNTTLVPNVDYTVSFADNVNAGTATVTVNGIGNYTGTTTETFTIAPKQIDDYSIYYSPIQEVYPFANGASVEPDSLLVRDTLINNYELQKGTEGDEKDYTIDYLSEYDALERQDGANLHSYAGQVTMTVKGQGNYTGEKVFTYYIGEDISQCRTLVNGRDSVSVEYNGLVLIPTASSITVIAGGSTDLTDANGEKRYDIAYYKGGFEKTDVVTRDQIVDAATYYVAVVGVPSKGTYAKSSESNSCKFTINPRSIAPSYILVSGYDGTYYYTGQQICPKGIAVEDTDLPVSLDENDPQRRTVKLINGIDYDLAYANNTSAGKASIIVSGKGNYAGSRVAYFNIISSNADGNNTWDGSSEGTGSISNGSTTIAASDIILGYDNSVYNCMMYNGYERIPTVNIAGISNSDFIVTASNNVQPGVATLTITGRGTNFTGTIIKNYKIKADLSTYGTISRIDDQVYTGSQITPHVTVTCGRNVLNQGSDFTVSYMNNTNVGRATVMATATSDSYYIGTATGSFNISNTAVGMEITGYASTYTYTGNAISPDVVVTMNGRTLTRGTDYTVTYSNNINVGTATMTINGIGSFSGTKTINYTIEAKNIENCLTTAVTNYQYTGSTYTPNVTVTDSANGKTLVAGTDYTITYSNNTNPGTALITVTALSNNYTGTKVIPFKITSASVSGLRTSTIKNNSIKLAWTAQDYADGYQICNSSNRVVATTNKNSYTVKGLTSCTTYKFKVRSYVENADGSISYGGFSTAVSAKTLLNTPTLKATSKSKGKVKLTWTKVAKATGYEIYYSTKKNGVYTRLKTISKSSNRKYVDSGLASGEKYYYTIRAYRTSNGVKTYSNYNTIKAVKVK